MTEHSDLIARLRRAIHLAERMGVRGAAPSNIYNLADEAADAIEAAESKLAAQEAVIDNINPIVSHIDYAWNDVAAVRDELDGDQRDTLDEALRRMSAAIRMLLPDMFWPDATALSTGGGARPMTGIWVTLTDEQKAAVLAYDGDETIGNPEDFKGD